jgi:CheY-like chemotaxis protein
MSSDRPGKNNSPAANSDSDRDSEPHQRTTRERIEQGQNRGSAPEFAIATSARREHDNQYAREHNAPAHSAPTDPTDQDEPSSLNELLAGDSKNLNKVNQLVDAFDTAQSRSARKNKKNPPADLRARDASVGTAKPRKAAATTPAVSPELRALMARAVAEAPEMRDQSQAIEIDSPDSTAGLPASMIPAMPAAAPAPLKSAKEPSAYNASAPADNVAVSAPPSTPNADAPATAFSETPADQSIASAEPAKSADPNYVRLPKDSPGADRRKRRRVKLGMRVLVRGGVGTYDSFDDITLSVDVSRDGFLVISNRPGYWVHQPVEVVFPYSTHPDSVATAQKARILRATQLADGRWGLAIELKAPRHEDVGEYASAPITRQVKVMVVETDPRMGDIVKELLVGDGYQVVIVPTAREALELLDNDIPDLILAEVECGNISGNDLCTIIKNDARLNHIPVILMTNNAKPADYALGHQAGAVICMAKPYPPNRLHHAVRLIAPPPSERSSYSARANISSFVRTS